LQIRDTAKDQKHRFRKFTILREFPRIRRALPVIPAPISCDHATMR
jgi:hypothetical protein